MLKRFLLSFALTLAPPLGAAEDLPTRLLATQCLTCHGLPTGDAGSISPIAVHDAAELHRLLLDFKAERLPSTIMGRITRGYSDEQLRLIALYFASEPDAVRP